MRHVINYVEKRIAMQLDLAKNLTKLVQTSRPQLQEESYLPFQSIYCTALDNDLELCASIQTSCGLLQGYKVKYDCNNYTMSIKLNRESLPKKF